MKRNAILLLTVLLMLFASVFEVKAQRGSIAGCVYENGNISLSFVSIAVKGQPVGTQTDEHGNYSILGVNEGDVLEFSYIDRL